MKITKWITLSLGLFPHFLVVHSDRILASQICDDCKVSTRYAARKTPCSVQRCKGVANGRGNTDVKKACRDLCDDVNSGSTAKNACRNNGFCAGQVSAPDNEGEGTGVTIDIEPGDGPGMDTDEGPTGTDIGGSQTDSCDNCLQSVESATKKKSCSVNKCKSTAKFLNDNAVEGDCDSLCQRVKFACDAGGACTQQGFCTGVGSC